MVAVDQRDVTRASPPPDVVRRELERPPDGAVVRVERDNRAAEEGWAVERAGEGRCLGGAGDDVGNVCSRVGDPA